MSGHDFNSTHTPTARKAHNCGECGRQIEPGERYERTAAVWEGTFFTDVACAHCAAARVLVQDMDPHYYEVFYGGLGMEFSELWTEFGLAMVRLYAGFRAHWRYQSGALMPVPEVPK